jgi:type IV pilus assembly protein PilO
MQLSLSKLPWYGQVGVFALVSAGAVATYWYVFDAPMRAEMAVRQRQLDALRQEIVKGQMTAAKLPEFRAQIADLEARLESLRTVLPEQKDVGDLLRRIQTLATQSNLEIHAFRPQPIVQKQMHAEWPIALELEGTYHDLALFFDRVSKVPRIINIGNITIKGKDGDRTARSQGTGAATITAQCQATTFVLSEGPPPAPAARPGAAPARPGAAPARPAAAPPRPGAR